MHRRRSRPAIDIEDGTLVSPSDLLHEQPAHPPLAPSPSKRRMRSVRSSSALDAK
jgi:hypothetical protein